MTEKEFFHQSAIVYHSEILVLSFTFRLPDPWAFRPAFIFVEFIFKAVHKRLPACLNHILRNTNSPPFFLAVAGFYQNPYCCCSPLPCSQNPDLEVKEFHILEPGIKLLQAFLSALSRAFTGPLPSLAVCSILPSTSSFIVASAWGGSPSFFFSSISLKPRSLKYRFLAFIAF